MKMSKENYLKFREFYRFTCKTATDADMEIIFKALAMVAQSMKDYIAANDKNGKN